MIPLIDFPWHAQHWARFSVQRQQNRVPHALLISGIEGLGQREFADTVIARVLCEDELSDKACMKCHSCQLFNVGNHPDHIDIEPEESSKVIKIDQIRKLKDKQELTPIVSKWKTVRVSPADKMNISSSNSLLKLLEEPQANTLLILVTSQPELLPITIRSRCQSVNLIAPGFEQLESWLRSFQADGVANLSRLEELSVLASNAPLKVVDYLNESMVDTLDALDESFKALIAGNVNPVTLSKNWQNYDEKLIFKYLQHKMRQELTSQFKANTHKTRFYWHIYDKTIEVLKLLASSNNINKTLLFEQFMVSVINYNENDSIV